jgi:hypothetical protein
MKFILALLLISNLPKSGYPDTPVDKLMNVYVVPRQELIVVQWKSLNTETLGIELRNSEGKCVQKTVLTPGTTIAYLNTQTVYAGTYVLFICNGKESVNQKIVLEK